MKFFRKICFVATLLLLAMPMVAATANGVGKSEKKVWQDSDPNKENYFNNRRALVGPGCMINSLFDGVEVVSGTKDLQNICNDDLDDYATIPALANVTVVGNPIISVKDNQHYYAGGTEAGFVICAADASILSLDLAKVYKIQFLMDGKAVGKLQEISIGKSVTGLGLSLLTIPGSDQINKLYMATAPGDFDEIKLVQFGVDAKLGTAINIKYAFVGKAREYTITNNNENGIKNYEKDFNRKTITLSGDQKLYDEDLTNSVLNNIGSVEVRATPTDDQEVFPAGTEIGFKYKVKDGLSLGIGAFTKITLYSKEYKTDLFGVNHDIETENHTVDVGVLDLGVIKGKEDAEVVIKSTKPFSKAKLTFGGVKLELGATTVNYAFVRMAPDAASHHCPINATSSRDVCGCENEFQLQHNDAVSVTWQIKEQPSDSNVTLDETTGKVTNLVVPGKYVFVATATDGCAEEVTLNYAPYYNPEEHGVNILVNKEGEPAKYKLSDNNGFSAVQIADGMDNRSAILTPTLNDFVYSKPGLSLINNKGLVGIRTVDGSLLSNGFNGKMEVGFVVTTKATGLSADVLNLYNIKLYCNGQKVTEKITTYWDAISAGLIGSGDVRKMRLRVIVPQGCKFDEVVLYKTGVASVDLSQLNVYYAYVSDANIVNATTDMLYGAEVVSFENTNASIDFENTTMFQVANIGNGYNELSNLVDSSLDTHLTLPMGVDLGGANISVNIGKTVDKGQQLVMVTDHLTLGLGASLGEGLELTTWLDGKQQEKLTNWKVLGADVIGGKANAYAVLNPTLPFDQVRIKPIKVLTALNNLQIKGFALRSNMNDDGTLNGCDDLLILDEDYTLNVTKTYTGAKMLLHRTFTKNATNDKKGWNSIILPVDMTAAQVNEAFGEGTQLARFNALEENWIKFSTVDVAADGVVLEKNTPYIIYPTREPLGNYTYTIDRETKTLNGPVYVANGINYQDQTSDLTHTVNGGGDMTYTGSYSNPTAVSKGSYMFSKGDLVHTSKDHNVKAYRCWLTEDAPSGRMLMFSLDGNGMGGTTGIHVIEENKQNTNTGIYNLGGVRMNTNNVDKLPKGVYIVNNKVVVKK